MYMAKTDSWYLERIIYLIAGVMVLLSLALAYFFSEYWLILTALVGINLIIFALSGFCIMANILVKLGVKPKDN
ncbi:MAG: DUF2892 domain-containing protein [Candidatus Gastranaerophilales bacterium]|nr:DUF2892 domain-containing protein [Candidatus Gastranaerophilales bacterium]